MLEFQNLESGQHGGSGLTIRALHHYDLGLLVPNARSAAGDRLYDGEDLLRLQQIIIGRELGLPLEAIRRSLDDPAFDRRQALLSQRTELAARAERAVDMIRAIDAAPPPRAPMPIEASAKA